MSLVIVTYVPDGIVMASDSRQSITIEGKTPDGQALPKIDTINSDNVYKTFLLSRKDEKNLPLFDVGISAFGQDLLGGVSLASHIKRFTEEEITSKDDVTTIPGKLLNFLRKSYPDADTGFHIAGYRKEQRVSVPYVFNCHVSKGINNRRNLRPNGSVDYGAMWSGQIDVISGIILPSYSIGTDTQPVHIQKPPIVWDAMPLQDAIDFSVYAIHTTIETIRFQARPKNVGGPIDVLVLTPERTEWIQKKELRIN